MAGDPQGFEQHHKSNELDFDNSEFERLVERVTKSVLESVRARNESENSVEGNSKTPPNL